MPPANSCFAQKKNKGQKSSDSSSKATQTLSEPDATIEAKRPRLDENDVITDDLQPSAPIIALNSISEYMQQRDLNKLSRDDLEQICLLKMCEAIRHKSEIGELRHQLNVQEQMIHTFRDEAERLTKQARDLGIVNKRVLHEVRLKSDKPLIPVKMTRSVGLQVRLDNNVMCNVTSPHKRRFSQPQQSSTTNTPPKPQQNSFNQNKTAPSPTNITPINQSVPPSPLTKSPLPIKPKPVTPITPISLLSKELQNSTGQAANSSCMPTTPKTPVRTKSLSNASPKPIKPTKSNGVIDLTDEDEKKPSPTSANASSTVDTVSSVRIVSEPVTNTNTASSAEVINPFRIMYRYNNQLHQGVLATDSSKIESQKVMFKLNPNVIGQTNSVLTAAKNGSPAVVNNGTVRTNQVQSVRLSSPVATVRTSTSSKALLLCPPTKSALPIPAKPVSPITPILLLSKELQNSTGQAANSSCTPTTPKTPVRTKSLSNASPKPIKPTESNGVIDLTDEDEKKPSPTFANASSTVNTTQGVRIVSASVKNTNTASSTEFVNPSCIMYRYNNQVHQGVLATDSSKVESQEVMFKLNPNVIGQTAAKNGSPIVANNGTVRTNQVQSVRLSSPVTTVRTSPWSEAVAKHPATLPPLPPPVTQIHSAARLPIPPKPHLSIRRWSGGIVLSWKMPYDLDNYETIASYQLYVYKETTSLPSSDMWRKVGDVTALTLPMACTLTHEFADINKYYFAIRAVDVQKRMGLFSDPEQILL